MVSKVNKNTHAPKAPKAQPAKATNTAKNVSSMPPTPKPTGTWITGENGSPDVYVPPSAQTHGTTPTQKPVPSTVSAKGSISFGRDWTDPVQGQLVAGGKLEVNYDMNRFSHLMTNSVDGFPAWGIKAYVMAQPSGQIQERELMDFSDGMGSTHGTPRTTAQSFDIPAGTTSVEVWFKNWTGADSPRESYDSNFGKNYRFDVQQPSGAN